MPRDAPHGGARAVGADEHPGAQACPVLERDRHVIGLDAEALEPGRAAQRDVPGALDPIEQGELHDAVLDDVAERVGTDVARVEARAPATADDRRGPARGGARTARPIAPLPPTGAIVIRLPRVGPVRAAARAPPRAPVHPVPDHHLAVRAAAPGAHARPRADAAEHPLGGDAQRRDADVVLGLGTRLERRGPRALEHADRQLPRLGQRRGEQAAGHAAAGDDHVESRFFRHGHPGSPRRRRRSARLYEAAARTVRAVQHRRPESLS